VAAVSFPEETEQAVEEERGSLSELSQWLDENNGNSAKRLQMQIAPVAADTTVLRSLDWDRARFDIEFGLSDGTTYNSYLIKGADKIALVDSSHAKARASGTPLGATTLLRCASSRKPTWLRCRRRWSCQRSTTWW